MNGEDTPSDGWRADDGPESEPRQWVAPGDEGRSPSPTSPVQQPGFAPPQQPAAPNQQPGAPNQQPGAPYPDGQWGGPNQQAGAPYPGGRPGAPYQQAGFGAPIAGPPPWTPGVAPRKRRTGLIVGLSVAAAVLLLGGVGVAGVAVSSGHGHTKKLLQSDGLVSQSPSPTPGSPAAEPSGPKRSLTVPDSAGGYDHVTSSAADRAVADIRASMIKAQPSYAGIYRKAKVGLYRKLDAPTDQLIYMGMSAGDEPELDGALRNVPAKTIATVIIGNLGIDNATDQPPGPLGGVLRCGQAAPGGIPVSSCVWVDGATLGIVVLRPGVEDATTARRSLALRAAAEH